MKTAQELIDELAKFPPDTRVFTLGELGGLVDFYDVKEVAYTTRPLMRENYENAKHFGRDPKIGAIIS